MTPLAPYQPRRPGRSVFVPVRGLDVHLTIWGDPAATPQPLLLMLHGFMDVGASFQFVVDALPDCGAGQRCVIAPDWRGFGRTRAPAAVDSYWFPDYLGDLDALLDALSPKAPVDLLGHSMGGNVAMTYAGVRPQRVRRLVNLEGFGMPDAKAEDAPRRLARWLDELKAPARLRPYASLAEVAARLRQNNPRLAADRADWLAAQWAEPSPPRASADEPTEMPADASAENSGDTQIASTSEGGWRLLADPAHKRVNPVPYRAAEAVATWRRITAPLLWIEGSESRPDAWWGGRYSKAEFQARLAAVPRVESCVLAGAGHMLHHDQPEALAARLEVFLG